MTTYQNTINKKISERQSIEKTNYLNKLLRMILNELLSDNKRFESNLNPRKYGIVTDSFSNDNRYDESIVKINEIADFLKPFGLIIYHDDYSKENIVVPDPSFFKDYQPILKKNILKNYLDSSPK